MGKRKERGMRGGEGTNRRWESERDRTEGDGGMGEEREGEGGKRRRRGRGQEGSLGGRNSGKDV